MAGQGGGAESQGERTKRGVLQRQDSSQSELITLEAYLLLAFIGFPTKPQRLLGHCLRKRQAGTVKPLALKEKICFLNILVCEMNLASPSTSVRIEMKNCGS